MGLNWAPNFVQISSLIPLYTSNISQPAFTKLPVFLLLLLLFIYLYSFKKKVNFEGGTQK
jgi:hypothetical protein